jgi:hypothetical protein
MDFASLENDGFWKSTLNPDLSDIINIYIYGIRFEPTSSLQMDSNPKK